MRKYPQKTRFCRTNVDGMILEHEIRSTAAVLQPNATQNRHRLYRYP